MTIPWFRTMAELQGHIEPEELQPEGYEAARAILDAQDELGALRMILFDLHTDVATRYVAMPVRHRHTNDCGRA